MKEIIAALDKYNYWYQNPDTDLGLIRERYLQSLKKASNNRLIKVVVGQRRAGKSYIIRQLIHFLITENKIPAKNIFYLNKELYEFESIKTAQHLYELIDAYKTVIEPEGKIYYFLDEIQDIEQWEKLVVSLAQNPSAQAEVFITGSNSKLLSGELATKLSGRYLLFEIFPFSYKEFAAHHGLENNKQSFIKYLTDTSLPEAVKLTDAEIKRFYFRSLKDTILLQDIMNRHGIRDSVLLEDLFLFILHNIGNMTSISSIIKYFNSKNRKADYSTLSNYLAYIESAFIIHSVPRYFIKNKEILSGERKYYINDLGFRNYLYPNMNIDYASALENSVYLHLKNAGYRISVGYGKNYEIDFIGQKDSQTIYLQVSYLLESEATIEREFGAYEHINDFHPKYVLTMDDISLNNTNGIKHQHIWDFLWQM
jgi:predicted AAA+ superfamily ATPase